MDAKSIPLDLSEHVRWERGGVVWTLGYLPLGKDDELRVAFAEAYAPVIEARPAEGDASPEARARFLAVARETRPFVLRAYADFVRWGVVGWDLPGLPSTKERVTYGGESYDVLPARVVALLGRVDHGALLEELALRVMQMNALTQEDLLGFR
jgi:hypothetical protein